MDDKKLALVFKTSPKLLAKVDELFDKLDFHHQQHVSSEAAAASISMVFMTFRGPLERHGISLRDPSRSEVMSWFPESEWDTSRRLDRAEFHQFYAHVVSMAGGSIAQSAVRGYGPAALGGLAGLMTLKRVMRIIPVVKIIISPILGFFPVVIVGPVLGVALMHKHKSGRR